MKNYKSFALIICLLLFITVNAQKQCDFKIDTAAILHNSNLNSFISAIKTVNFEVSNNKKDIPNFLKSQLDCMSHGFSIANLGRPFQETDIVTWKIKKLPLRQLTFLAKSNTILVLGYQKGGFGKSKHVLLVKFENKKIIDLWAGSCLRDITSIEDIVSILNEQEIIKPNISDF